MKNILITILSGLFFISASSQDTLKINDTANVVIEENFDKLSKLFAQIQDMDNHLWVEDGNYNLNRKNSYVPYAAILDFKNNLNDLSIITNVKIDAKKDNEQTIGIIFMIQKTGKDGYIFEINQNKEYRVRQINKGYYLYITGNKDKNGWVKSKAINPISEYNTLEAKVYHGIYYMYANGQLLTTFFNSNYNAGGLGLLVGPKTKATSEYFKVIAYNEKKEVAVNSYKDITEVISDTISESVSIIDTIPIEVVDTIINVEKTEVQKNDTITNSTIKPIDSIVSVDSIIIEPKVVDNRNPEQRKIDSLMSIIALKENTIEELKKEEVKEASEDKKELVENYNKLFIAYDSLKFEMAKLAAQKTENNSSGTKKVSGSNDISSEVMNISKSNTELRDSISMLFELINSLKMEITHMNDRMGKIELTNYNLQKSIQGIKED